MHKVMPLVFAVHSSTWSLFLLPNPSPVIISGVVLDRRRPHSAASTVTDFQDVDAEPKTAGLAVRDASPVHAQLRGGHSCAAGLEPNLLPVVAGAHAGHR